MKNQHENTTILTKKKGILVGFEPLLKVKEKIIKITIRDAKVSDAHPIGSAQREIAKTPGFFCSLPDELTDENVEKTILGCLHAKNGVFLVAECEDRIVGHAFLEPLLPSSLQHIAELNIVVHLGWQRQGIGTLLIKKLLEKASHTEIEKIELSVRASNAYAISLYKAMGFREEGRLKNHIKTKDGYFDDILMALNVKEKKPLSTFIIRIVQEKDISILSKTFCFPWTTKQATEEKWKRYYTEQQNQVRTVHLLESNNQLIGYGSLLRASEYQSFKNEDIPEINDVWIHKEMRNQGFGQKLITSLENMARKVGYKKVGIGVGLYKDYGVAQRLYVQMGYIPDGNGITYKGQSGIPGTPYPLDDDLILWLTKSLMS